MKKPNNMFDIKTNGVKNLKWLKWLRIVSPISAVINGLICFGDITSSYAEIGYLSIIINLFSIVACIYLAAIHLEINKMSIRTYYLLQLYPFMCFFDRVYVGFFVWQITGNAVDILYSLLYFLFGLLIIGTPNLIYFQKRRYLFFDEPMSNDRLHQREKERNPSLPKTNEQISRRTNLVEEAITENNCYCNEEFVILHFLSPVSGYKKDTLKITDKNRDMINKWLNKDTNSIYCFEKYSDGMPHRYYTTKENFEAIKLQLDEIGW